MLLALTEKHKKDLAFLKRIDASSETYICDKCDVLLTLSLSSLALEQFCQLALKFILDGFDRQLFL